MVFSFPGYFLIGLAGVLLISSQVSGRIRRGVWLCFASAFLFAGYVIGRSLASPIEYLARTDFYMAAGALLVYGITVIYFTNARWRVGLVAALLVCAIAHTIVGAIQFTDGHNFMLLPGDLKLLLVIDADGRQRPEQLGVLKPYPVRTWTHATLAHDVVIGFLLFRTELFRWDFGVPTKGRRKQ